MCKRTWTDKTQVTGGGVCVCGGGGARNVCMRVLYVVGVFTFAVVTVVLVMLVLVLVMVAPVLVMLVLRPY